MKSYISEYIGTFCLVFCGTGAIIINTIYPNSITHLGISATFGLIVLAMIYTIGDISGAHINPAVTIGFYLSGLISLKNTGIYIIVQCAGAISASLLLYFFFPQATTLGETIPTIISYKAFLFEIILTFILMYVIINVATGVKETGILAGIAIGSTVLLEALFAGPVTGASMNPARSLGPAIISGKIQYLWIYIPAPIIGSSCAILICRLIKGKECCI